MNSTVHIAGPFTYNLVDDTKNVQRCSNCGDVLKDFRRGHGLYPTGSLVESSPSHLTGGVVYPEGSLVERGPTYQAMLIHGKGPTCSTSS
jgi:hypothetical protein